MAKSPKPNPDERPTPERLAHYLECATPEVFSPWERELIAEVRALREELAAVTYTEPVEGYALVRGPNGTAGAAEALLREFGRRGREIERLREELAHAAKFNERAMVLNERSLSAADNVEELLAEVRRQREKLERVEATCAAYDKMLQGRGWAGVTPQSVAAAFRSAIAAPFPKVTVIEPRDPGPPGGIVKVSREEVAEMFPELDEPSGPDWPFATKPADLAEVRALREELASRPAASVSVYALNPAHQEQANRIAASLPAYVDNVAALVKVTGLIAPALEQNGLPNLARQLRKALKPFEGP